MGDGYEADVSDIRGDAAIWKKAATDLGPPKTTVQSLTLQTYEIGLYATVAGLGETYEQLRKRIDTLLGGAQKSYNNISTTLGNVATAYEKQESDGEGHLSDAGRGTEGS